jgi:electron transfer flavoprotein beta subunit
VSLVLMGKQEIEGDFGVVPQMLAGRLGWPQAMFAAGIAVAEDGALEVTCERDAGARTLKVPLPAVVSADLRLAQPRFVSLPNLMKAKRRPIDTVTPAELGVSPARHFDIPRMEAAETARAGEMARDIDQFIEMLRAKGVWPD